MKMQLAYTALSPYCRKVRMAMQYKGLDFEIVTADHVTGHVSHGVTRVTPGRSLPTVVKANVPVGHGGWMTLSRSHRQSNPVFTVWRPFSQVSVSAISVTLVLKSEAVFVGDPIC